MMYGSATQKALIDIVYNIYLKLKCLKNREVGGGWKSHFFWTIEAFATKCGMLCISMTQSVTHDIWIAYLKVKVRVRIQIFQTIAAHVFTFFSFFFSIYIFYYLYMDRTFVIVVKLHVMLQVGRTEMIKDTLDPNFVKKFIVDYFFEERQLLTFAM